MSSGYTNQSSNQHSELEGTDNRPHTACTRVQHSELNGSSKQGPELEGEENHPHQDEPEAPTRVHSLSTLAYLALVGKKILDLDCSCGCTVNGFHIKPHFRKRNHSDKKPNGDEVNIISSCIQCSRWIGMSAYPNNGVWEDEDEICVNPSIHEILQSPLGKSKLRRNRNNYYIKTGPKWHYRNKKLIGIWQS